MGTQEQTLVAFVLYSLMSAITPGPNNLIALSTSLSHGFKKSLPFGCGVIVGFLLVYTVCAAFTNALARDVPVILSVIKYIGVLYIFFLAFRVLKPKGGDGQKAGPVFSFRQAVLMQFVNPKSFLFAATALTTFILPRYSGRAGAVALTGFVLSLLGFAGTTVWSAFGTVFRRWFEKYRAAANAVMAAVLIYTGIVFLLA